MKKVVVNMACGLANRMFQYSYYLYLKSIGADVAVDFYEVARLPHEQVPWERIFPEARFMQAPRSLVLLLGGGSGFISRVRRRLGLAGCVVQMPAAFDYWTPDMNKGGDKYVIGVFQNAQMVESVRDSVKHAFEFSPFEDDRNIALAGEMSSCESVAVHVRKGNDYMQRKWYKGTCMKAYYEKAFELVRSKVASPRFYVFTDNPGWVRDNFTGLEYILVEGNPSSGWGCHHDMQLMTCCRHNIISNSTYSWWGAYLNPSLDKIVVAPEIWFNPDSCEEYRSDRLLCSGWNAI